MRLSCTIGSYATVPVAPGGKLYYLLEEHSVRLFLLFTCDYYGTELHEFLQTLELLQEAIEKIYWLNA